jgi:hypothetical protein
MRIRSFRVAGFANFAAPVHMGPLQDVNVVYGANNVGKSNFLRAVDLYFRLMGSGDGVSKQNTQIVDRTEEDFLSAVAAGWNRDEAVPITFEVEWSLTDKDLEQYGLFPEVPCSRVVTSLDLRLANRSLELRTPSWLIGDQDVAALDKTKEGAVVTFGQQLRRLLADKRPFKQENPLLPVGFLGRKTDLFAQELRDGLFDARMSARSEERKRWAVFSELAGTLTSELGEGSWETTFDRTRGRANVVYVRGEETMSLETMGAGVQRFAGLLAELALTEEPWVCMEEPEWRLSPELQVRFVALARRVIQSGVGPRQLFVTTHSPTLAGAGLPFAMESAGGIITLEQKPWELSGGGPGLADAAKADAAIDNLIGLVDTLADMDPNAILPGAPAPVGAAAGGAAQGGPRPAWQPGGR